MWSGLHEASLLSATPASQVILGPSLRALLNDDATVDERPNGRGPRRVRKPRTLQALGLAQRRLDPSEYLKDGRLVRLAVTGSRDSATAPTREGSFGSHDWRRVVARRELGDVHLVRRQHFRRKLADVPVMREQQHLRLLPQLRAQAQVLLFTHHRHIGELATKV